MNLIFWDHGGGSVSGYGYDQKFPNSGSMNLSGINKALKDAGIKYDFIGFDACLMATLENGLMLSDYADYMIASEETEPGVGWYYTNWLTALGKNPSMSTVELGKEMVDEFVEECNRSVRGQKTTLSVVDLAELKATVPEKLSSFSTDLASTIQEADTDGIKALAQARADTREFAQSSKIDQVDLVNLTQNINSPEGADLAEAVKKAVKYNRTSSNMTNAYGISIYFPCKKPSKVTNAVQTYEAIGMDDEYTRCIQAYAKLGAAGQTTGSSYELGGAGALGSLLGGMTGSSGGSTIDYGALIQMVGQMALSDRTISDEATADFVQANHIDDSALNWTKDDQGRSILALTTEQWDLVTSVEQNMYVDDGSGYIDLGLDNLYDTDGTNIIADEDRTWLAINGQVVPYYHLTSDETEDGDYSITGYVPALLNNERVNLILEFNNENPYGFIAGAQTDYKNGETELQAKNLGALNTGDTLDFICDYYTYDGEYQDSYMIGEQLTVTDDMEISNVSIADMKTEITYKLTDIYGAEHWSAVLE